MEVGDLPAAVQHHLHLPSRQVQDCLSRQEWPEKKEKSSCPLPVTTQTNVEEVTVEEVLHSRSDA